MGDTSSAAVSSSITDIGGEFTSTTANSTETSTSFTSSTSLTSTSTSDTTTSKTRSSTTSTTPTSTTPTRTSSTSPSTVTTIITKTPAGGETTIVQTSFLSTPPSTTSTTTPAALQGTGSAAAGGDSSGSNPTTIAVAVVVPVVVVALVAIAAIFLWRRHKNKKDTKELRRKEVEDYGFNPNADGKSPIGGIIASETTEDGGSSGYRGWGGTANTNRKMSTTMSSQFSAPGAPMSENSSVPGAHHSPHSSGQDGYAAEPPMRPHRDTLDSDQIGALGGSTARNSDRPSGGMHRGPSNASSSYSAANRSDDSHGGGPKDFYENNYTAYGQNPYEPQAYQPVIQDVSARRNTRIESPVNPPPQGNAGIAQNF